MKKSSAMIMATLTFAAAGCKSHPAAPGGETPIPVPEAVFKAEPLTGSAPMNMMPRAVIYKMNGDYSQNVPITLNPEGTAVVSFPAPSDLTENSTPLLMNDGYYLDRRGISARSRFTTYTYQEYRSLPQPPSPAELLKSVIPDARIIDVHVLPMTQSAALSDTAAVNAFIADLNP